MDQTFTPEWHGDTLEYVKETPEWLGDTLEYVKDTSEYLEDTLEYDKDTTEWPGDTFEYGKDTPQQHNTCPFSSKAIPFRLLWEEKTIENFKPTLTSPKMNGIILKEWWPITLKSNHVVSAVR